MTALTPIPAASENLPSLIDRAATMLASAKTAAEVLEAREAAGLAYDVAKRAARLKNAKAAHDDLVAAAHRAQADALEIEAAAKRRLADEYDAAQARGEIAGHGGGRNFKVSNGNVENSSGDHSADDHGEIGVADQTIRLATSAELGLSRKAIHEARLIRDAEVAEPGIVRRTLDATLEQGDEPTRTALRKMVVDAAMRGMRPERKPSRRNPLYVPPTPDQAAWQHVTGTFRAFAEWATEENLSRAQQGMHAARDSQFYHLDVAAIAAGSKAFKKIKEWFDA